MTSRPPAHGAGAEALTCGHKCGSTPRPGAQHGRTIGRCWAISLQEWACLPHAPWCVPGMALQVYDLDQALMMAGPLTCS